MIFHPAARRCLYTKDGYEAKEALLQTKNSEDVVSAIEQAPGIPVCNKNELGADQYQIACIECIFILLPFSQYLCSSPEKRKTT